ncbi:MAG: phosphomannomutase/phosphoglucomutase [Thermoanaerobaculia bacterium]|nr:phosphomannomutase/phosphoglucomutase [Thermoanaerobaculia bacterium]
MAGIFKAYDVRGLYPSQLNEELAEKIGRAFWHVLDHEGFTHGKQIVVSNDMRSHSKPLKAALIRGLTGAGLDVLDIGLATTPMNYFAVGSLGTAGGVQVTASHNPAEYNGLKFSLDDARPVSGDHGIAMLEEKVASGDLPVATVPGKVTTADVTEAYRTHVLSYLHRPEGARRLRVVVDAANGMGTIYEPLLESLGIDLVKLYFELDGTFPNHEANPLKLENLLDLAAAVRREGADLGVSFDGDADRAAFVDESGEPIGSDLATALIAGELLKARPGGHVVYDLRSSRAVAEYITEHGGIPLRERVGHSFIKATMRKTDAAFGGELAGHYYFRENYFADCAVLAVVEMLNILWQEDKPASAVVAPLRRYAKSPETNFKVEDKQARMQLLAETYSDGEIDWLDGVSVNYPDWWFNVRPSNTEPYLRLVVEASSEEALAQHMKSLLDILGEPV